MSYKSLFVSPVGVVVQNGDDKGSPVEAEFLIGGTRVVRNETKHNTSGSSQTLSSTAFAPLNIAGDTSRDINSGSDVFQESVAGGGDSLSWSNHRSTAGLVKYQFRAVAPAAGGAKIIQVAHKLSGSGNGNEFTPSDVSSRYFALNSHIVSASMNSDWCTGQFLIPVDARLRASGSMLTAACAGTVVITSASVSIFEV